jgi:hypothetical protein
MLKKGLKNLKKRCFIIFVAFLFFINTIYPYDLELLSPTKLIDIYSASLDLPLLRGIKYNPQNPFEFSFFIDEGTINLSQEKLKQNIENLIKYFLAGLAIPYSDLWVNLSVYEKNRIIPSNLEDTILGENLLIQDYLLKKLTASLICPNNYYGKEFWEKVYTKKHTRFIKLPNYPLIPSTKYGLFRIKQKSLNTKTMPL